MTAAFPILHDPEIKSIPWEVIQPHEAHTLINHGKSLADLASAGGLTPEEALAVIEGRPWERMAFTVARRRLTDYVNGAMGRVDGELAELSALLTGMRDGKLTERRGNYNKAIVMIDRIREKARK